mgnify:CR=1 FL=1
MSHTTTLTRNGIFEHTHFLVHNPHRRFETRMTVSVINHLGLSTAFSFTLASCNILRWSIRSTPRYGFGKECNGIVFSLGSEHRDLVLLLQYFGVTFVLSIEFVRIIISNSTTCI